MTAFETVVGYWPPLALFGFVAVYAALSLLVPRIMNGFEENFIALLLAVLTITAFSQVIARYLFLSGWTFSVRATFRNAAPESRTSALKKARRFQGLAQRAAITTACL